MGPLGELDGIQRSADVAVLGQQEASEPAALIGKAHGQHEGKGLYQARVGLWGQGSKVSVRLTLLSISIMCLVLEIFLKKVLKKTFILISTSLGSSTSFIVQRSRVERIQKGS